jgi:hypothetical protein
MYAQRQTYSRLGGMWFVDVGPQDQVIEIWPYADHQTRADAIVAASKDPACRWPSRAADFIISRRVDVLEPIAGMADWSGEKEWGGIYEFRVTTYAVDEINKHAAGFSKHLQDRATVYPVAGIFTATLGLMHHLYQIHPFKDWNHRNQVRSEFYRTGVWPPPHDLYPHPVTEVVYYMTPSALSPLH